MLPQSNQNKYYNYDKYNNKDVWLAVAEGFPMTKTVFTETGKNVKLEKKFAC